MSKNEAKKEVSNILYKVLQHEDYWSDGYLQWGKLEKALKAVIDRVDTSEQSMTQKDRNMSNLSNLDNYDAQCAKWAEEEQAKLWEPHVIWRVRYAAYPPEEAANVTEAVHTLDDPADIITAIRQHGYASIDKVESDGHVTEGFVIATFLDAECVSFHRPPASTERYPLHRHYCAGAYVVNVPPFILHEPRPAPVNPDQPQPAAHDIIVGFG